MALCKLERRNYGGKVPVSIKYQNLHSFKEGLILLCQSILEMKRITHLHHSAHFTILLTASYLLKETKLLVKISHCEFLVMTEKNIFVYKLLLLNISDFSLFFVKIATPLKKVTSLFSSNPLSKLRSWEALNFWKFGRRFNPLPLPPIPQQKGGVHSMCWY